MKQDRGVTYTIRRAIQAKLKSLSLQQTALRHWHQSDTENKVDGLPGSRPGKSPELPDSSRRQSLGLILLLLHSFPVLFRSLAVHVRDVQNRRYTTCAFARHIGKKSSRQLH